jgi:hypothetical protein
MLENVDHGFASRSGRVITLEAPIIIWRIKTPIEAERRCPAIINFIVAMAKAMGFRLTASYGCEAIEFQQLRFSSIGATLALHYKP